MNDSTGRRSSILLLVALALGLAVVAGPLRATCEVTPADAAPFERPGTLEGDVFTWTARRGDRVRCDVAGYEPLDFTCEGCDGDISLRLEAARGVELRWPSTETGVELEWRRFGPPGEPSELLARRLVEGRAVSDSKASATLPVARHEDRLLRFHVAGSAPRTFFVPAGGGESERLAFELEPPAAGGEIVGFVEAPDFFPEALRLRGVGSRRGQHTLYADAFGFFEAAGLGPGAYELEALFAGGTILPGPRLDLEAGESVELFPWLLPPLGGLEVQLGEELCAALDQAGTGTGAAPHFVLRPLGGPARDATRDAAARDAAARDAAAREEGAVRLPAACQARLEGLEPGEWSLQLLSLAGASASSGPTATAMVEAGELAWLELDPARVLVDGTVSIAVDQPVADLEVELLPAESAAEEAVPIRTRSDAAGRFQLSAPGAGAYVLRLRTAEGFPILDRELELEAGENGLDIDLGDAGLWVRLVRADGGEIDEPVTVELRVAGNPQPLRTGSVEARGGAALVETLIYDLTFQRYEISAFTTSGWVALERPVVELAKGAPVMEVDLILEERSAAVTIYDPNGRPATGLKVAVDQREIFAEEPGRYPLLGAAAGSRLFVLPPPSSVPVCRILDGDSLEIHLREAGAQLVLVPPKDGMPEPGSFLGVIEGLPGSECPMPVSLMWQPFENEQGQPRILLRGLTDGTFRLRHARGETMLQVPGPEVALSGMR